MWFKKLFILFLVSLFISAVALAQQTSEKKDSTTLYKNIETYSKRNKFNTFLYRLIFKPISIITKKEATRKGYKKLIRTPYVKFQGKIIRNINIVTLDPFGYSVNDTSSSQNRFTKAANALHVKTRVLAIRNLLLIHKNEPFNSFFVKESERLVRSQKFIHDVSFFVTLTGVKSDSVDIYIRELDIWSIYPQISASSSQMLIGITDQNFLGTGHEFKNVFSRNIPTGISSFNTNYFIPNIMTSYISTMLHYGIDGYGNIRRSITIDRPFYSPYARWAAGISISSQVNKDSLTNMDPFYVPLNLKFSSRDIWAGKAIRILKGSTEEDLATNLIFTGRYLRIRYNEKPSDINDSLHIYSDEDFFLAGIGISTRKYVQDTYIFKYGTVEDVPVGKVLELTAGYQLRKNSWRTYLGVRLSFGNYNEWGYLSTNIDIGAYFRGSKREQGVFTVGANYFTGLIEIGKWKFRQFAKPQVTIGLNRAAYDSLTLNEGLGINGFNSKILSGTSRILLTLQTQFYSPWNLLGFNFGPFIDFSAGMLGNELSGFRKSQVYTQFGFGVQIKNENLIFNTFQVSISFYPIIPGNGQNIFKMNAFSTADFGFRDFEIGKPEPSVYR
jgi:hypothetical protein